MWAPQANDSFQGGNRFVYLRYWSVYPYLVIYRCHVDLLQAANYGRAEFNRQPPISRSRLQSRSLRARARGLRSKLFARAQRQWTFRRHRPNFHRRAVVQTWKIFGDFCSLFEATHLEQEKATDRFLRFGKRAVRDGTTFLL